MDLTIPKPVEGLRLRIANFVERKIIPHESDPSAYDPHGNVDEMLLERLREEARGEGLWCLQLPPDLGGPGIGRVGMAVCYEAMNRSIFGPVGFNAAARDERDVQGRKQKQNQPPPPPGGKDW